MNGYSGSISRGTRAAEASLWVFAGLLMLTAHVSGAVWLLREQPVILADDTPPAAIMIEMAPIPEAVFTEANEVAPDLETAELSLPSEEALTPEETPVAEAAEPVELEPAKNAIEPDPEAAQTVEEEVVTPVEQELAALPDTEVPLPTARSPSQEKKPKAKAEPRKKAVSVTKPEEPKKKPVRQQQQAASKSAMQAQAQVTQTDRNAGRQSAAGVSSVSPVQWQSRLMAHLERRKRYPSSARSRGEEGTVHVRFRIDDGGNVLSVTLAHSSGFPDLDNEVLSLVRRASPVPAPPSGVNKTITAPVRFSRR